jgi:glycosyltransferase involved in cell wall biosynthesis
MKKIIFHYPGPFYESLNTGEKKRPKKICEAFSQLGYEVVRMIGSRSERKKVFDKIKDSISDFSFIYSENSTLPLGLCGDNNHLPTCNSVDYQLFKVAHKNGIPIGVFYRDFYWQYPPFKKEIGYLKYFVSLPYYQKEVSIYKKYADCIFVPSAESIDWLPIKRNEKKLQPLPPGEELHDLRNISEKDKINLIYVGSIMPPKYNMSQLFNDIGKYSKTQLTLTLVTREDDWKKYSTFYSIPDNVSYRQAQGDELKELYLEADIALYYLDPDPYTKIRLPIKLFEAIGFGLPLICYGDTAVSRFVIDNQIGWTSGGKENSNIFEELINNPSSLIEKKENVRKIRDQHTWRNRAEQVRDTLLKIKE